MAKDLLTTGQHIRIESIDAAIRTRELQQNTNESGGGVLDLAKDYEDYIRRETPLPAKHQGANDDD